MGSRIWKVLLDATRHRIEVTWNRDSTVVCFSVDGVVKQKYTSMFGGQTRSYFSLTGAKLVFDYGLGSHQVKVTEMKEEEFQCEIDGQPAEDFGIGDLTAQWEPRVDGETFLVELDTGSLELRVDGRVIRDAEHLSKERAKRVCSGRYEWTHGDHSLAVNVTTAVYNFESEGAQGKDFDQCLPTYILELDGKIVPVRKRAKPPPPSSSKTSSGGGRGKMLKK